MLHLSSVRILLQAMNNVLAIDSPYLYICASSTAYAMPRGLYKCHRICRISKVKRADSQRSGALHIRRSNCVLSKSATVAGCDVL